MPAMKEAAAEFLAHRRIADEVESVRGYRDLKSIPGGVGGVVIGTAPDKGSVSPTAAAYGRAHGITVIDGGCPLMFDPTADFGHKVLRIVLAGRIPKTV